MVTCIISAGSVYGHSPECIAWTQTYVADYYNIHTVRIDTDAGTVTFYRFLERDGSKHRDPITGEPEEDTPEVVPLRALPDVLDVLAVLERHEDAARRRSKEREEAYAS